MNQNYGKSAHFATAPLLRGGLCTDPDLGCMGELILMTASTVAAGLE